MSCSLEVCLLNSKRFLIIASQNGCVESYTCPGWKVQKEFQIKESFITSLKCVEKYSWLLAGNFYGEISLIQIDNIEKLAEYNKAHFGLVNFLELYQDNYFFSLSSDDNFVVFWNICNKDALKIFDLNYYNNFNERIDYSMYDCSYVEPSGVSSRKVKIKRIEDYGLIKRRLLCYYLLDENFLFLIDDSLQVFCVNLRSIELIPQIKAEENRKNIRNMKKGRV
eukprot:CAMPEP_0170521760 /NCGR_PEP_ID=MMETSP0209-20121228/7137_1 /TAXON_ID=665100 ORGANISM="Litonotus pictus, Strain P1" /NCGR_SAMPLE_ID=MMETSP0209 /ASSEMBLY_ACC=CAM_ASM_000301 /LENGTH=222 /DNA_ID=CAMNT_0010808821 /DNA_START=516 /DNA_END=1180 /DNA_ORIENTATION=-